MLTTRNYLRIALLPVVAAVVACGGGDDGSSSGRPGGGGARPGGGGGWGGGPGGGQPAAAVPVETAAVERRDISSFIETNGTLEAENDVDLVARISAPVIELATEEGMVVRKGQVLARLDDREIRAQLEIQKVALAEAERAFRRSEALHDENLLSPEQLDAARSSWESALAQVQSTEIQLSYTTIEAPFGGLISARYVNLAQQVSVNTPLFRLTDFDPLLCPIQVPERELNRISIGQPATLRVEAFRDRTFDAKVLRIRPIVDAATGTVRVTLAVDGEEKLRPGMFARVAVQAETRSNALVIPRRALSLEAIGDVVYVAGDGAAQRREVQLGFQEGDSVEILSGLETGERVVVVGQDGLSDGTPIQVLSDEPAGQMAAAGPPEAGAGRGGFDPTSMTEEQLEKVKERMRSRGMTEEQIEARLAAMGRETGGAPPGAGPPAAQPGGGFGGGPPDGFDPSTLTDEQKDRIRARMRERGMSEDEIARRLGDDTSDSE